MDGSGPIPPKSERRSQKPREKEAPSAGKSAHHRITPASADKQLQGAKPSEDTHLPLSEKTPRNPAQKYLGQMKEIPDIREAIKLLQKMEKLSIKPDELQAARKVVRQLVCSQMAETLVSHFRENRTLNHFLCGLSSASEYVSKQWHTVQTLAGSHYIYLDKRETIKALTRELEKLVHKPTRVSFSDQDTVHRIPERSHSPTETCVETSITPTPVPDIDSIASAGIQNSPLFHNFLASCMNLEDLSELIATLNQYDEAVCAEAVRVARQHYGEICCLKIVEHLFERYRNLKDQESAIERIHSLLEKPYQEMLHDFSENHQLAIATALGFVPKKLEEYLPEASLRKHLQAMIDHPMPES